MKIITSADDGFLGGFLGVFFDGKKVFSLLRQKEATLCRHRDRENWKKLKTKQKLSENCQIQGLRLIM
jgi:hypothetical protein